MDNILSRLLYSIIVGRQVDHVQEVAKAELARQAALAKKRSQITPLLKNLPPANVPSHVALAQIDRDELFIACMLRNKVPPPLDLETGYPLTAFTSDLPRVEPATRRRKDSSDASVHAVVARSPTDDFRGMAVPCGVCSASLVLVEMNYFFTSYGWYCGGIKHFVRHYRCPYADGVGHRAAAKAKAAYDVRVEVAWSAFNDDFDGEAKWRHPSGLILTQKEHAQEDPEWFKWKFDEQSWEPKSARSRRAIKELDVAKMRWEKAVEIARAETMKADHHET